jgi:hypothetical protein
LATRVVIENHYLHRKSNVRFAFGLFTSNGLVGVVVFGTPASRHLQISACKTDPQNVVELNRLWVSDTMPRNTESWFVSRALKSLPALIVVSYADTQQGHFGYIYRALGFNYAGWTDMERKTPRYDYVVPGKHSRDAFRTGYSHRVQRLPKVRYWIVTGNKRERKALMRKCTWPILDWRTSRPPGELVVRLPSTGSATRAAQ